MKKYQSKARLEIKGTGLGGENLSESKQLLEDITERFEKSKRRFKADTPKKDSLYRKRKRTGFFEWVKKKKLKKEQNHKFLNKSPRINGEEAKFSENDLLYDIDQFITA